ncbi:hypothetical protein ACFVGY_04305 [Streptomyces sp. NPDC127106]|uniref:hypothetical protein n=1 Tax=Streptomyces sp. NPDC127106 TaxID=3345360 RepID=UPI003641A4E7
MVQTAGRRRCDDDQQQDGEQPPHSRCRGGVVVAGTGVERHGSSGEPAGGRGRTEGARVLG